MWGSVAPPIWRSRTPWLVSTSGPSKPELERGCDRRARHPGRARNTQDLGGSTRCRWVGQDNESAHGSGWRGRRRSLRCSPAPARRDRLQVGAVVTDAIDSDDRDRQAAAVSAAVAGRVPTIDPAGSSTTPSVGATNAQPGSVRMSWRDSRNGCGHRRRGSPERGRRTGRSGNPRIRRPQAPCWSRDPGDRHGRCGRC